MEVLRGALIGFGFIAERGHAPAYASRTAPLEIVAVAEPCAARHAAVRAALPNARIYAQVGDLLDRERLDFVDICAPPCEHMHCSLAAFTRGLHVLCEKPLAMTPREARLMSSVAVRAQRVLYPSHSYRHAPVVRAVRELLVRDVIGQPRMVTLDTFRTTHARGVKEWRPDWRRDPRYSGAGILMDHGPHTAYLAFEWMRGYPTSVSAWARSIQGDAVEDEATFTMVFPGGLALAHLSWNAGFRRIIYTLHGDRGAIRIEDDDIDLVIRAPDGELRSAKSENPSDWRDAGHGPWFEGVLRDFAAAIERRYWVSSDTRDAIVGIEVISAARVSAGRGGTSAALPASQNALEKCA